MVVSVNGKDTALFSKNSDEWSTPQWLYNLLHSEFKFQFDPCCTFKNQKCQYGTGLDERSAYGYHQSFDSLAINWFERGYKSCFLNPPYSKIAAFMKKAFEESQKGAIVVCLIPARTDTKYWHDYVMKAAEIRFVKGRLKFGDQTNSAPFPSVIVVFKPPRKQANIMCEICTLGDGPIIGRTIEQPRSMTPGERRAEEQKQQENNSIAAGA